MPEAEVPEEEYDSFGYALTKLEPDDYDSIAEYIQAGKEKMNNFYIGRKRRNKKFFLKKNKKRIRFYCIISIYKRNIRKNLDWKILLL